MEPASRSVKPLQGALLLALSALLFAFTGVGIREISVSVNNESVVFFRNLVGVLFFLPLLLVRGVQTPQALHDTFRRLTTWAAPVATLARAVLLLAGAALTAIALTG